MCITRPGGPNEFLARLTRQYLDGKRIQGRTRQAYLSMRYLALLALAGTIGVGFHLEFLAEQLPSSQVRGASVRFKDIRMSAGISFLQDATQTEEKYYLETMGTGVGWIDYDQDGLMDLYLVQSAATDIYKPPQPLRSALFHNNGDGTFTDATGKARVGAEGLYGPCVGVGDFDEQGCAAISVPGYGRAILYHNNGDGTF